jgi:putative transposase
MNLGHSIGDLILGAVAGSAITFWILTREKRAVSRIKKDVSLLVSFHDVPEKKYQQYLYNQSKLFRDDDVLAYYKWSCGVVAAYPGKWRSKDKIHKLGAIRIAAEGIVCEGMLGISRLDGVRALVGAKDLRDLRSPKQLEEENGKLKKIVADLTLDKTMLQDVLRRKW